MTEGYVADQWDSLCTHAGRYHDQFGSVIPPIYQSSTFQFDSAEQGGRRFAGEEGGYIYTRLGNPTLVHLEHRLAALEGTEDCAVTASGMGAIASVFWTLLKAGDHVIVGRQLYGCTVSLLENQIAKFGVDITFIDEWTPGCVTNNLRPNTRFVYFESPTNPSLAIIDIAQVVKEAKAQEGVLVICDNTFCSPILTQPIKYGVDIIIHSMTKYLNGHTDVIAGCICSTSAFIQRFKMEGLKDCTGAILSPNDAFLVERGLLTLKMRVLQACNSAQKIAEFLTTHPAVESVTFPGLPSHPQHELAKKQMAAFGSMISFELKSGVEGGRKFLNSLKFIVLAVSLGGCISLISHPASTTHSPVPRDERLAAGITDGLVRFSVGIEDPADIIADLKQALDQLL
ncbi:Chain A, Methionine Gamma-Lyase [Tritrichomonas foetus]|uniref:L-methionine gamma-lyase n=1 Tax=Tritrichomonas foetus TaxID=1144522 RepID=A0A1J4KFB7_9EUKA|nr:Chain A, Methionine Gamma-Lyase [Tritrichomonas foetus]|eukprot:OHT08069.1 Chain A, Methionine Gamma-Lyase [Tritrichomonas foetus]